jgi:hypothetical protein
MRAMNDLESFTPYDTHPCALHQLTAIPIFATHLPIFSVRILAARPFTSLLLVHVDFLIQKKEKEERAGKEVVAK